MNTTAILCGIFGLLAYFFYYLIGVSKNGDDGQGVNRPVQNDFSNPEPSASQQRGRWE